MIIPLNLRNNTNKPDFHVFDASIAKELGSVDMAVLIQLFSCWIDSNQEKNINLHENKTWIFETLDDIASQCPYFSKDKVKRLIKKLIYEKVLIKGNFNEDKFDHTSSYTFHKDFINDVSKWKNRHKEEAVS